MFFSCGKFQVREHARESSHEVTPVQSSFETMFSQTGFHSISVMSRQAFDCEHVIWKFEEFDAFCG